MDGWIDVWSKDERGGPGPSGIPRPDCATLKNLGHWAIFCLIWEMVWSRIQETSQDGNGVVFSWCRIFFFLIFFFYGSGLMFNFDSSEMIHIHTLRIQYAHAAANLNSGYSKYAKVARVHYFCTIALRISRAVLTRT